MDGASEAIPASEGRSAKSLELVLATNESITIDLDPLPSPEELEVVIDILVEEKPAAYFWTALASRCWNAADWICQLLVPTWPMPLAITTSCG